MSTEELLAFVGAGLGAGGLGAILSYMLARRKTSGSVEPSEASELWAETREFRRAQTAEIVLLRERLLLTDQTVMETRQLYRECEQRDVARGIEIQALKTQLAERQEIAEVGRVVAEAVAGVAAKVEGVHEEVRTANGMRLGELADLARTEKIEEKDAADRTAADERHVAAVPPENGGAL